MAAMTWVRTNDGRFRCDACNITVRLNDHPPLDSGGNPVIRHTCKSGQPRPETAVRTGKCHICQEQKPIAYCGFCGHWMCSACRRNWGARGIAALKELVGGKKPGCCGQSDQ